MLCGFPTFITRIYNIIDTLNKGAHSQLVTSLHKHALVQISLPDINFLALFASEQVGSSPTFDNKYINMQI